MTDFAELTTLRVGGPIRRLVEATSGEHLVEVVRDAWASTDDWFLLGGGSNLVVADAGFDGTVIRVATRGVERATDGVPRVRIEAGEPWDDVVAFAVKHGLAGIEALSGIPGTAGAGPIQNIGAYGQQLGDTLLSIEFLDFETGDVATLSMDELDLGYRTSSLKQGRLGVVLSLELALVDNDGLSGPIAYAQLASALGVELGSRLPLAEVRRAVLALRSDKGMVWNPADPDSISAGSFFTNPIVSESFARTLPSDAPRFPIEDDPAPRVLPLGSTVPPVAAGDYQVKLSAAWLIERAGVARGFSLPGSGAAISSKHTLAIVNRGGATAADIVQLAGYLQTRVLSEFGVVLQPEPTLVGLEL